MSLHPQILFEYPGLVYRFSTLVSRVITFRLILPAAGLGLDHLGRFQPDLLPAARSAPVSPPPSDTSCLRHNAPPARSPDPVTSAIEDRGVRCAPAKY